MNMEILIPDCIYNITKWLTYDDIISLKQTSKTMFKLVKIWKRDVSKIMHECFISAISLGATTPHYIQCHPHGHDGYPNNKPKIVKHTFFNGLFKTDVVKIYEHSAYTIGFCNDIKGLRDGTYYLYCMNPIDCNDSCVITAQRDEIPHIKNIKWITRIKYKNDENLNNTLTIDFYTNAMYGTSIIGYFLMDEVQYANLKMFLRHNCFDMQQRNERLGYPLNYDYIGLLYDWTQTDKHCYNRIWCSTLTKSSRLHTERLYEISNAFVNNNTKLPICIQLNGSDHFIWCNTFRELIIMLVWLQKANYDPEFTMKKILKFLRKDEMERRLVESLRKYYENNEKFNKSLDELLQLK